MLHCVNPLGGEPLTGEPDAGDPPVRFGGRGNETNRLLLPLYQAAKPKPASVEATTLDGEGETFRRRSRTFPKNTRDLVQLDEGVLVRWGIV